MKYATLHLSAILWLSLCALSQAKEVRLYTQRHYPADKEFFAQFTKDTGIEVKVIKAGANELLTRLESEKAAPQADLFITTDAGALDRALLGREVLAHVAVAPPLREQQRAHLAAQDVRAPVSE